MGLGPLRVTAICLLGAAVLFGAVAQFLPWMSNSGSQGTISGTSGEKVWGVSSSASDSSSGLSFSFSKNWFACWSDAKLANDVPYPALPCPNSIVLLDSAGPLMLLGMAALVTAAILVGVRPGKAAKILGLCGATALTLAAVFMVVGLMMANSDGNFNGENFGHKQDHPFSPDFGMYLGIAMAVAAVVGAVLIMMAKAAPAAPSLPYAQPYPQAMYGGVPRPQMSAAPPMGGRRLKCPKCQSVFMVAPGARPKCTACGYGG